MADIDERRLARVLLERYGNRSIMEQADISAKDAPNTLFQLWQLGVMVGMRVRPDTAAEAFLAFRDRGWTTAKHLLDARHDDRAGVLRDLGYPERDADRASRMMGDAAAHLLERYGGRLDDLRDDAGGDPARIREELKRFLEVDDHVVDAFFREVQLFWEQLRPFADKGALDAASRLGLGEDAEALQRVVDDEVELVRLVDSLVRLRHDDAYEEIRQEALAG